jgi:glycosyltransferase involved in cell wall biosynthesis
VPRTVARASPRVSDLRLTVIVAVRDGEDFVEAAVTSVLNQTYQALRLLIIDDGSTDRTSAILHRLATEDDRIDVVANAGEAGLAGALAYAFDAVSTEYIARLDADDLAMPDRIAQQVEYLDRHPAIGLLGSACIAFDKDGNGEVWSLPTEPLAVRWRSLLANPFLHPTVTIRRTVLADAKLNYDARLPAAQDYDLWSRALRHTDGANLTVPLVRYRLHDAQVTARHRDDQLEVHDMIAFRTIRAELPDVHLDESHVRDLRALFYGGGQLPRDPIETASLYLDLLDAFLNRADRRATDHTALKRAEAMHVLSALTHSGNVVRGRRLAMRLLRLDPALPLRAVSHTLSRREGRWSR